MPLFSYDAEKFLGQLEPYLDRGPTNSVQELAEVPPLLTKFEENDNVAIAVKAIQLLGTAVGAQKAWQQPYQECGILAHVLTRLDPSASSVELSKQCLRVIGNSVADNDSNREHAMLTFGNLIACLKVEELNITTLAVMLNLCNDYDPAQEEAAKHRLDSTLSDYLVREKIPEAALDYATDLLAWTTEKLTSAQLKDDTSLKVFDDVLEVIETCDEDHYTDFLAIIALYLQDTEFQLKLATPERLEKLVDLVLENENRLGPEEIEQVFRGLSASSDPEKLALDDTSVVLLVQLINSVGAISASDAFVNNFGSRTPAVKKIKSKLLSPKYSPSTVCACVMLGNLATSDKACIEMVEDQGLHLTLISLLSSSKEPALLYAAAGYMRHLTFPEANRTVLGESGLIETCCQLLVQKDPSVRGEAAAMLCKLVTNNFYNIEKVVYESIPDDVPATSLEGVQTPAHATILYHVVSQSLVPSEPLPSTTMKNPMIELGRTIIAILRYLGRPNAEVDVESVARHMFKTPLVARPVARLVRQRFYADARSEGVLGLGLLAQSPEGAAAVIEEVKADEGLLAAIKEFAVEQDKDGQRAGRDCQNALVFLHGLTANGAMDPPLKEGIDALQAELERLVV